MLHPLDVCLDLLHDPRLPLRLLRIAPALVDALCQALDVLLGVHQVAVVWVVLWGVLQQVLGTGGDEV